MKYHRLWCAKCKTEIQSSSPQKFCGDCGRPLRDLARGEEPLDHPEDFAGDDDDDDGDPETLDGLDGIVDRFDAISERFKNAMETRLNMKLDEAEDRAVDAFGSLLDGVDKFVDLIERGRR